MQTIRDSLEGAREHDRRLGIDPGPVTDSDVMRTAVADSLTGAAVWGVALTYQLLTQDRPA